MNCSKNLGILLFDDVEVLDFCGPFEVFSITRASTDGESSRKPFNVFTVAENPEIRARNGLRVLSDYSLGESPPMDILLLPGGMGIRQQISNEPLIDWIKDRTEKAELVLSVCTGALLLAEAGLLDGLEATTHHQAINRLRKMAPHTRVRDDRRFVDNGKYILAAGISAGIDMSLYTVARLLGRETALETARHMEYAWEPSIDKE